MNQLHPSISWKFRNQLHFECYKPINRNQTAEIQIPWWSKHYISTPKPLRKSGYERTQNFCRTRIEAAATAPLFYQAAPTPPPRHRQQQPKLLIRSGSWLAVDGPGTVSGAWPAGRASPRGRQPAGAHRVGDTHSWLTVQDDRQGYLGVWGISWGYPGSG